MIIEKRECVNTKTTTCDNGKNNDKEKNKVELNKTARSSSDLDTAAVTV